MTAITLSTVGYREVAPLTPAAQLFTIGADLHRTRRRALRRFPGGGRCDRRAPATRLREAQGGATDRAPRGSLHRLRLRPHGAHRLQGARGQAGAVRRRRPRSRGAAAAPTRSGCLSVDGDATEDASWCTPASRAPAVWSARSRATRTTSTSSSPRASSTRTCSSSPAPRTSAARRKLMHAGATRVVSPYVLGGSRMAGALLRPAVIDVIDLATHHRSIELQDRRVRGDERRVHGRP